jgi:hypothetical protein
VNASGLKTIDSQVKDSVKEGAEILTGGEQIGITSDLNFQSLMTFTTFADFTIQGIGFRIRFGDDARSFILFSISLFNHS